VCCLSSWIRIFSVWLTRVLTRRSCNPAPPQWLARACWLRPQLGESSIAAAPCSRWVRVRISSKCGRFLLRVHQRRMQFFLQRGQACTLACFPGGKQLAQRIETIVGTTGSAGLRRATLLTGIC